MKKLLGLFLAIIIVFVFLFAGGAFFVVKQTEYCIVTKFGGEINKVYMKPGLYMKVPFYNQLSYYPARARSIDSPPEHIVTGDQKKLIVDNYVKWRISDPVKFRNRIAKKMSEEKFLESAGDRVSIITLNALKDVLGSEMLADVISTSRNGIANKAQMMAALETQDLGIEILDVRIKRVDFPSVNVEKVYHRMQAERFKEANYYRSRGEEQSLIVRAESDKEVTTLVTDAEKEAKFIMATADAEAAQMYADSYNKDPEFYGFYRSLQALKKTVDSTTTLMISPNSELYRYLINP